MEESFAQRRCISMFVGY